MENLHLYGLAKVNQELHARAAVLDRDYSESEKLARLLAWNSFVEDRCKLDDSYSAVMGVARLRYGEAIEIMASHGRRMETDVEQFAKQFYDELFVINKKVTNKGVQWVFYAFVALGLFGLYKLFF